MYSLFNGKGNVIGSGVSLSHIAGKGDKGTHSSADILPLNDAPYLDRN